MAFVAGNFDDAAYNKAKIKMSQLMSDENAYGHLRQPGTIFNTIGQKQAIRLGGPQTMVLTDGRRCEGLDVSWLNICDLTVSEGDVDCELDGDELGAQKKTYVPNLTFHKAIKVPDSQCKDVHELEEKRALAMLGILATMDQELERRIITFLNANADTLTGLTLPVGTIDGVDATEWDIPIANATADLFIDLEQFAATLNMVNPLVIDGNNFYTLLKKAEARIGGNCCNTDNAFKLLPIVQNFKTVDQVSGEKRTFLVDTVNIAYFNTVVNKNSAPIAKGDRDNTKVWSMPSRTLKWRNGNTLEPVMYDVKYQYQCISGHDYVEVYHAEHRGAFILGPSNCNDRHGIVKITVNP